MFVEAEKRGIPCFRCQSTFSSPLGDPSKTISSTGPQLPSSTPSVMDWIVFVQIRSRLCFRQSTNGCGDVLGNDTSGTHVSQAHLASRRAGLWTGIWGRGIRHEVRQDQGTQRPWLWVSCHLLFSSVSLSTNWRCYLESFYDSSWPQDWHQVPCTTHSFIHSANIDHIH